MLDNDEHLKHHKLTADQLVTRAALSTTRIKALKMGFRL
jgi:hypothetical protein